MNVWVDFLLCFSFTVSLVSVISVGRCVWVIGPCCRMFSIVLGRGNGASIAALPTTMCVVVGHKAVRLRNGSYPMLYLVQYLHPLT